MSIRIELVGYVIPAMKNSKMLTRGRLITKPEYQQRMAGIIRDLESQLNCVSQISGLGTSTVQQQHSWIASSLPADDSWQWIPELNVKAVLVEKGSEGALITIEEI